MHDPFAGKERGHTRKNVTCLGKGEEEASESDVTLSATEPTAIAPTKLSTPFALSLAALRT